MKYLEVPFTFKDKDGNTSVVCFFIPKSFIDNGDLQGWGLKPDNFLGVDLKKLAEQMSED